MHISMNAFVAPGRWQRVRANVDTPGRGLEARGTPGAAAAVRRRDLSFGRKTTSILSAGAQERGVTASGSDESSHRDVAASAKIGATGDKRPTRDLDVEAAEAEDESMNIVLPAPGPAAMAQTGSSSTSTSSSGGGGGGGGGGGRGLLSRLARGKGASMLPPRHSRGRSKSTSTGGGDGSAVPSSGNSRSTIRSPAGGSSDPTSLDFAEVSELNDTAPVTGTADEAGIHSDVASGGVVGGNDALLATQTPAAVTVAAAAEGIDEVTVAKTPLLTPASPPPAPSSDGYVAKADCLSSPATIGTGLSSSSGSSSGSSSSHAGGGGGRSSGGKGEEGGVADTLVARLARVVAFVERELLGDPQGIAAAAAVAAVHPDVTRLSHPAPPSSAVQPLELFAEAPMTGRLLARAAAEAAPQRKVTAAPGADEWKLLGGPTPTPLLQLTAGTRDAVPNHLAGIVDRSDIGSSGAGQGTSGQSGGDWDSDSDKSSSRPSAFVADELFRAREQEQLRYKSYLRQFVPRVEPAGSAGRGSSGDQMQNQKQQRRQQQQQRGLSPQTKSRETVGPVDGNSPEDGSSNEELRRALLGEVSYTSDWLQLRTLLNVAREANQLDLRIVAAVFKRAAGLLTKVQGGGSDPEGSGGLPVRSRAPSSGSMRSCVIGSGGAAEDGGSSRTTPVSPVVPTALGPAEVEAYSAFCNRLTAAAVTALERGHAIKTPASVGADADGGHAGSGHGVAQIAYGMGMLQIKSKKLYDAVLRVSGEQLRALAAHRAAAAAVTAAAAAVLARGGTNGSTANGRAPRGRSIFAEMAAQAAVAVNGDGAASTDTAGPPPSRQHRNRRVRTAAAAVPPPPPAEPWTLYDFSDLAWGVALAYGGSSAVEATSNTAADTVAPTAAVVARAPSLPLPDRAWLKALCDATLASLTTCDSTLLWRLLWSMARLSYVPPEEWMRLFLDRVRYSLADFEPQDLCRIAWSLAALEVVPDKLWMRALVGQLHNRLRDLTPDQLVSLYGALARLGYAPRPEVGSGFHAAAVRLMPLMSGSQLAALAYHAASFDRWRPSRSFLAELARAVRPHAAALSPAEASRLLWAWSRSASQQQQLLADLPAQQQQLQPQQRQQLQPQQQGTGGESLPPQLMEVLLDRVLYGMRSGTTDGNDLSMTLWALAVMRRLPGAEWMAVWWRAAADPQVAATFDDTCVAQSLWAAAQLRTLAGPADEAAMYGSSGGGSGGDGESHLSPLPAAAAVATMLSRISGLLRSTSTANLSTTIAALADLQYRPSDAWMTLFAAEARRRLGSETAVNEDHGLIAYGLAVLGWPLEEPWVKELAAGGYRRMAGMGGEALGLFLWGLSQYGWSTDSKRFWNMVFRETGAKWDSCSARSVVLLYCAVADMMPPDMEPPLQWQRQLARSLRLRVPRPPAAALIPEALRAAAGGCLGPSLLRLRGPAAVAAATPGGLHVNLAAAAAAGITSGFQRTRRSALDESLWSSLVYGTNLYGDLKISTELDEDKR
ncbi:hypothetical protein Vretifemale_9687, partial [Volvox reticuliferus]